MRTLELLRDDAAAYDRLESISAQVEGMMRDAAARAGVPVTVQRVGSMVTPFFKDGPVRNFADAQACDTKAFARWHHALLEQGVYWPPSQFEAGFVSLAHDEDALERTQQALEVAFRA
jgi:glutamate-1-semialdehyde 2,1-aminomutase